MLKFNSKLQTLCRVKQRRLVNLFCVPFPFEPPVSARCLLLRVINHEINVTAQPQG